jgi:hypothetical protein
MSSGSRPSTFGNAAAQARKMKIGEIIASMNSPVVQPLAPAMMARMPHQKLTTATRIRSAQAKGKASQVTRRRA